MHCPNCNEIIPNNSRFCFACGEQIHKPVSQGISMVCRKCGGKLDIQEAKSTILFCPYCGAKELIPESDYVKVEKHKSDNVRRVEYRKTDANKDVELDRTDKEYRIKKAEIKAKRERGENILIILVFSLLGLIILGFLVGEAITTIEENRTERHNRELLASGEIVMSAFSYYEYTDMNYDEAIEKLSNDGFSNIVPIKEKTGLFSKNKEGAVISVKIDDEPIETKKAYSPDVVVKITYYSND